MKQLPKPESSKMDVNTLLNHLTNLKTTINEKQKQINNRNMEIEGIKIKQFSNFFSVSVIIKLLFKINLVLENAYNQKKSQLENLKSKADSLKSKTVKLKDEIFNKLNFF